ncbi:MAG TPA: hypothetical protein VGS10_03310 [Terracidiphilus sp.]|nr:hypothetical protein [Terracidiphilus sp.]
MNADLALTLSGLCLELVLVAILIVRRIHRTLPSFLGFIAVALCTDALASLVPGFVSRELYLRFWIASLLLEFVFYIVLTFELGRNVLRRNRIASPNWFLAFALFIPAVWVLTLLSHWSIPPRLAFIWQVDLRVSQATAVLGLGAFLAFIWWSALRRLHWPPREFRIAVGIGLESLVAFVAVIIHTHQPVGPSYHWVDVGASVVYVAVLVYWVQYFVFEDHATSGSRRLAEELTSAGRADGRNEASRMGISTSPGGQIRS